MIYLFAMLISLNVLSFDDETRCTMNEIYIIELQRRCAPPDSNEFDMFTLEKNFLIGLLPNATTNNVYSSAQDFTRYTCDNWSSETIQLHLLLENRLYITRYRFLLTHSTTNRN